MPTRKRIPSREFLIFNQELATLLTAGMPLVQSLDLLKRRASSSTFQSVLDDVSSRVRSGAALSDAFVAHESLVPSAYVASLVAGERSGNIETVLRRYVSYAKTIAAVKSKTLSALIYPVILIAVALALVSLIVLWVVPQFADFYTSFGSDLPWMTRTIIGVSDFVRGHYLLLLLGLAAAVVAVVTFVQQPGQGVRLDHLLLRAPGVGDIATKLSTSQMARTLATLLGGGLPLVNALEIASRSVGNRFMAKELEIVGARVREGASFSASLEQRGIFPEVAVKMAEVGEATGALQDMLNTVADLYDEDVSTSMGRFVTLIEPALLVIMGIVIAALLLALYIPVFQAGAIVSQ
jgi:type IV pilus assembly protein PilC